MKRALLVMVIVMLVGLGIVSGYLWLHHSNTTIPGSTGGWTGEYFWQSGPDGLPTDAVLLTLLQSPSGVSGTWTEATTYTVDPLGGGGPNPNNSFPVQGVDVTASTLTLNGTDTTFQVNTATGGLTLTYTPSGGGIQTLNFERVPNGSRYNQAVAAIQYEDQKMATAGNS